MTVRNLAISVTVFVFVFNIVVFYAVNSAAITIENDAELDFEDEQDGFIDREGYFDNNDLQYSNIIFISTLDGKITALNVNSGGNVLWTLDADAAPLISGTFSAHQKELNGELPYTLVPSLDGSLYMLELERSLLRPVPLTADISKLVDDVAVTGGSLSSKTGINPLTGEIKYRCTSGRCEQRVPTTMSSQTLVITRNTQIARAADPFTGTEKWNLSVGEYAVQLFEANGSAQTLTMEFPSHVKFSLKPPVGIVSAYECGNLLWEHRLKSPIARVWQMAGGRLQEVSLFDCSNIEALNNFGEGCESDSTSSHFETPFYLGFYNAEPYILPSEKIRAHKHLPTFSSYGSEVAQRGNLYLHDLVSVGAFKRKYWPHSKEIEMAAETRKRITFLENCPLDEAVLVPGSREVNNAEPKNDDEIRGGWYINIPVVNPHHMLTSIKEPNTNIRGTSEERCFAKTAIIKRIEKKLKSRIFSRLWQVGGILLIFGSFSVLLFKKIEARFTRDDDVQEIKSRRSSTAVATGSTFSVTSDSSASTLVAPATPFISKFFEDFIPVRCLGRGGYGVVFNCRHKLDDGNYAVKRITVSNTKSAIERVKREAKAMAKLDHPFIIRYFHTWIERPPEGWQQAADKRILIQIRSGDTTNNVLSNTSKPQSDVKSNTFSSEKDDSFIHQTCKKTALLTEGSLNDSRKENGLGVSESASTSWAISEKNVEVSDDVSSGSSVDEENEAIGFGQTSDLNTSSIVFAQETESHKRKSAQRKKSSSSESLEPPLVLVAGDTDLKTCKKSKDYIYLYIQMELCQELTLHSWLVNNNAKEDRELDKMRYWFTQLVFAVAYIHDQGLIHRDIKPQNIFFAADGENILKIGDLGLATDSDTAEGVEGVHAVNTKHHTGDVGTKLYMSPEQLKKQSYNQKVDVFSLGLIFTEMLIPFQTVMERHKTLNALQKGALPQQYLKNCPREREFVKWLTTEDAECRPTCREVIQCDYLEDVVNLVNSSFRPDRSRHISSHSLTPTVG